MRINKTGLCLAISAALGVTNVHAAVPPEGVKIGATPNTTAQLFAKERNAENSAVFTNKTPATVGDLNITFPTAPSYTVNATNTLEMKIALLKGAKFNGTNVPVLTCQGMTGASVSTTVNGGLQQGGTKGSSAVSYSLPQGFTTTSNKGYCTLIVSSFAGLGADGLAVSARINYKNGLSPVSASYKGTIISFTTGSQFSVSTGASSVTADVQSESKLFTVAAGMFTKIKSGAVAAGNGKMAYLGFVQYKPTAATLRYAGSTAAYSNSAAISSGSLVLDGAGLAGGVSVVLTSAGKGCTAVGGSTQYKAGTLTTNAITIAGLTPKQLSGGLDVCLIVDGTKSIDQGTITASLKTLANTNFTPIVTPLNGLNSLATIKQNGTTIRILNLPAPGNPELGYVRMYNPTSQPIKITGSLYTLDGKPVGTATSSVLINAALPALSVQVLDVTALTTLFGTWAGKAMLRLDANSANFKAMGTIRDATGTLINASGSTKN